jgi:hypothetical protein
VSWVMLLLSQNTTACAVVNGFKSNKRRFQAAVRQGCPLAPCFCLFVAEALLRFLKAQPDLGIVIVGSRYIAAQYADDIDPILKSAEVVPVLMQSMNVFGCASNQHVNVDKSKLLPVGVPALAPLPGTIVGIPVTHSQLPPWASPSMPE